MEALAAISLAGNVVQFVELTAKLISDAREIKANGQPSSILDLKTLAENLTTQASIVKSQLQTSTAARPLSEENQVCDSRADLKLILTLGFAAPS
jgi:hypothetical protein